jgi:putative endonuclease
MTAWFYILRLQSGALYIGATKNLEKRYAAHCAGSAGRTTSLDPPTSIVYFEEHESFSKARQREAQVKRWSRAKKEALVVGDKNKLRLLSKSHKN